MTPYYQDKWVTIYHGDCREILPQLNVKVDLILTDLPYPDQHPEYGNCNISFLKSFTCRQLVFWTAKDNFPLDYTAIHIWDKRTSFTEYERIFERNGNHHYKLFSERTMGTKSPIIAQIYQDIITEHPSQKPQRLITRIISESSNPNDLILDPFLGSGTTCYCAKKLNRYSIGIEIEEKYCEIAARRCSQEVFELGI